MDFFRQTAFWGILTLLLLSTACSQKEKLSDSPAHAVSVQLGFRLGEDSGRPGVKGAVVDMTNPSHEKWGIGNIRMLAFESGNSTASLNLPTGLPELRKADLVGPNAHLYESADVSVPLRTASVLMYGKALPLSSSGNAVNDKHINGSLLESGMGRETAAIRFSPEAIDSGAAHEEAAVLLSVLNAIGFGEAYSTDCYYYDGESFIKVDGGVSLNWDMSISEPDLKLMYRYLCNDGELMAGAGDKVETRLNTLYSQLSAYESEDTRQYSVSVNGVERPAYNSNQTTIQYKQLYNGLRDVVKARFSKNEYLQISAEDAVTFLSDEVRTYPESLGLPAGAATLRWTSVGFVSAVADGLDGIPALSRYVYPPALYYYVSSPIHTSDKDMSSYYTDMYGNWNDIVGNYRLGTTVSNNATAVAVDLPLQYAVGKLKATVQARSAELQDREGNQVAVGDGSYFPVTGIIIGKQYPQFYNFTPDSSGEECFLYDREISGVNFSTDKSEPIHTLVLPTPQEEAVYFCVEMQNNSGSLFYGAEGRILPGQKFYLTGKLEIQQDKKEQFPSVFMSDYETTIHCVVSSLEWAHSAVPDLSVPLVSLGVQTQINWIVSTGTSVVLE